MVVSGIPRKIEHFGSSSRNCGIQTSSHHSTEPCVIPGYRELLLTKTAIISVVILYGFSIECAILRSCHPVCVLRTPTAFYYDTTTDVPCVFGIFLLPCPTNVGSTYKLHCHRTRYLVDIHFQSSSPGHHESPPERGSVNSHIVAWRP